MAARYCRTSFQCNRDASNGPTGMLEMELSRTSKRTRVTPAPRQSMAAFRPGCQLRRPVSLRSSQNSVPPDREFLGGDPVRFRRFRFLAGSPRHSIAVSVRELSCFQCCFSVPVSTYARGIGGPDMSAWALATFDERWRMVPRVHLHPVVCAATKGHQESNEKNAPVSVKPLTACWSQKAR
jgi:hypothetical protein